MGNQQRPKDLSLAFITSIAFAVDITCFRIDYDSVDSLIELS